MTNRERTIELREIDQAHSRQLAADVAAGFGGGQDMELTPAQKAHKQTLNRLAEAMGVKTKAGRKVFREGRSALAEADQKLTREKLTGGVVAGEKKEKGASGLASRLGVRTAEGERIFREGRRGFGGA